MNVPYNRVEMMRHDLATLARELDSGRLARVAAASELLANLEDFPQDEDLREAAHELRSSIASVLGYETADEDEVEYMFGIPAHEAFVCLSRAYGKDWARLAYADALAHLTEPTCREPLAVASAVLDRAAQSLAGRKMAVLAARTA